ncbi:hypothetical protein ACH5RR_021731 [Cinchona calisaya]|uniref:Uncharacterized protein n=1 Tax=Cinchona calisaya TaxID=153742 RepID=A0ABD2ZL33_9GENT
MTSPNKTPREKFLVLVIMLHLPGHVPWNFGPDKGALMGELMYTKLNSMRNKAKKFHCTTIRSSTSIATNSPNVDLWTSWCSWSIISQPSPVQQPSLVAFVQTGKGRGAFK